MKVPNAPPNAAPRVLNNALPRGSPDTTETIPTTKEPTMGILPKNFDTNGLAAVSYTHLTLPTKA